MPTQLNIQTNGSSGSAETIDESWFGAVQTGFHEFDGFRESAEVLNIGLVRWPGGTLSETRLEVYGLDKEGLFNATDLWAHDPNRDRHDLADAMDYSIDHGKAFSMIVPTARYASNIGLGETHLRGFLDDLFTGKYGALPDDFTLELGNEYKALPEFRDHPEIYGEVASRFAEVIGEAMDLYLTDAEQAGIKVAVQMGSTADQNTAIIDQFSPDALAVTNSLVFHSLPISLNNLNKDNPIHGGLNRYEAADSFAEAWRDAIIQAGGDPDPDLFLSAWTVGGSTHDPDNLSLEFHEFGLRSATVALDSVAGYSSIGVDSAAIWGVDVTNLNTVTTTENGVLELSHTGEMFRMMADSLVGKTYVGTFTPSSRSDPIISHTFSDGHELTTYVAINKLSSVNDQVLLDFSGANNIQLIHAEMLSTTLDPAFNGNYDDLEARLHELPVTWEMDNIFSREGLLIDFTHDYEVAEVEVVLGTGVTGTAGDDWIRGNFFGDTIQGYAGDDFLMGGSGYDSIYGGQGNDILYGDNGVDRLFGNQGDDTMYGGDQADLLVGGPGFDHYTGGGGDDWYQFTHGTDGGIIHDFEIGRDAIDMSDIFSEATSVMITGPSYSDLAAYLGPGGDGSTWRLEMSQVGEDTRMQIFDAEGDEASTIWLRGIATSDLTRDFFASIQLGRDEDRGATADTAPANTGLVDIAPVGTDGIPATPSDVAFTPPPDTPDHPAPPQESFFGKLKTFFTGSSGDDAGPRANIAETPEPEPEYVFEVSDWAPGPSTQPEAAANAAANATDVPDWMDQSDTGPGDLAAHSHFAHLALAI